MHRAVPADQGQRLRAVPGLELGGDHIPSGGVADRDRDLFIRIDVHNGAGGTAVGRKARIRSARSFGQGGLRQDRVERQVIRAPAQFGDGDPGGRVQTQAILEV